MNNIVLFIFEGESTEPKVLANIKKNFFDERVQTEFLTYNADIYQLWRDVSEDEDLDIIEILKERSTDNASKIANYNREDISEIYLFFDYDGHASLASDESISKMIEVFNEETEHGKLYINYPMVESLKDFKKDSDICSRRCEVDAKKNIKYKRLVHMDSAFRDVTSYAYDDWKFLASKTLSKANCIVNGIYRKPEYQEFLLMNQDTIFKNQIIKFIDTRATIATLSGFPLFVVEYVKIEFYEDLECCNSSTSEKCVCTS